MKRMLKGVGGGLGTRPGGAGAIRGPNLTQGKGSRTIGYSMADWDRIVRHGVKPDGSAALMPAEDYFKMSDAELVDIVAYIRSLPAVDAEVPGPSFGPVGKLLLAAGKLPLSAERQPSAERAHAGTAPETGDSVAFGAHLAAVHQLPWCESGGRPNGVWPPGLA